VKRSADTIGRSTSESEDQTVGTSPTFERKSEREAGEKRCEKRRKKPFLKLATFKLHLSFTLTPIETNYYSTVQYIESKVYLCLENAVYELIFAQKIFRNCTYKSNGKFL
jgi:hypothetical protein